MTMTDTATSTMAKAEGLEESTPEAEVKTPVARGKASSEALGTYTQSQVDALVHATQSEWGRRVKAVEQERDSVKADMELKLSELEGIQADRDSLQRQIEDLTSDDPKKFDLIKRDRELRDKERVLKGKMLSHEQKERAFTEREKKVSTFEFSVLVEAIADEYKDGDATRLKGAISGFDNPTEAQVRHIASILWEEKVEGNSQKTKGMKPYSGKTDGGFGYFTREQIADRDFWEKHRDEILKAQKEGRIR